MPRTTPAYAAPEHLGRLAELVGRALEGYPIRAVVSVPPRHGKTELLLHAIAWWLSRRGHGGDLLGYASYAADIARSKSRQAREYTRAAGVSLARDSAALHEWRTAAGGGLLATGVGGPLTGHGVRLLIVDDPFKNRADAESSIIRNAVHDWFRSTATTRVEPGGSIIVCHTRWHGDDLIGRLSADTETRWEQVVLPAVDEQGRALWPERWPVEALRARRSEVGEYEWSALFQQRPVPRGGEVFRGPTYYQALDLRGARIVLACDPAGTESTRSDHTAAVALAVHQAPTHAPGCARIPDRSGRCCYPLPSADVVDVLVGQWDTARAAAELRGFQARWGHAPLTIEASRDGKSIARVLRELAPGIVLSEVPPRGDKFTRAQPVASAWNEGRVRVPTAAPWLAGLLSEVARFTGVHDARDDQVDALAWAWTAGAAGAGASSGRSGL